MDTQASRRVTMAQAIIAYLKKQYVERDGVEQPFFAGCFGIFGHGNVAGIGACIEAARPQLLVEADEGTRFHQLRAELIVFCL